MSKERKQRNLEAAQTIRDLFTVHSEWHWSYTLQGKRLDYWPSKNKWRWDNKMYFGTATDLIRFINNRITLEI